MIILKIVAVSLILPFALLGEVTAQERPPQHVGFGTGVGVAGEDVENVKGTILSVNNILKYIEIRPLRNGYRQHQETIIFYIDNEKDLEGIQREDICDIRATESTVQKISCTHPTQSPPKPSRLLGTPEVKTPLPSSNPQGYGKEQFLDKRQEFTIQR